MEIIPLTYPITGLSKLAGDKPLSIAIGHFDGVHRGHQNVIRQAVAAARQAGLQSAVLTFDPHPKEVLGQGEQYYQCLTPLQVKTDLFAELGVDAVFVMKFNSEFAAVSPEGFVSEVLRTLGARQVVVGFDFKFGHRGAGDTELLKQLGRPEMNVHVVEPLVEDGLKVSSTLIRKSLASGDLEMAERLLGRPYEVTGLIVHGDGRGSTIGFPTANLQLQQPYVAPRLGVYAITAWLGDKRYFGVLNHGLKPTFNKQEIKPIMEAHLFDFQGDIYDERIRIQFRAFIRPEQKFSSVQDLIEQINADAVQARELMNQMG